MLDKDNNSDQGQQREIATFPLKGAVNCPLHYDHTRTAYELTHRNNAQGSLPPNATGVKEFTMSKFCLNM